MLNEIVAYKKEQLASINLAEEIKKIKEVIDFLPPTRSIIESLFDNEYISIIAEIKRKSPSKGILNPNLNVKSLARAYEFASAKAISALTEDKYFFGSVDDLIIAKESSNLPILRKDFIIDPFQVYQSRLIGADAILLITAILEPSELEDLYQLARNIDLEVIIEIHSENELKTVLNLNPDMIGINNRNLKTFEVDLVTTERLAPLIPQGIITICESGINSREDIVRIQKANVNAILIGEALVTSDDPYKKICELMGRSA
ncbi:MAG: indole-3-glycerol phosphate synthase TrpC [Candidatus Zixiibacteriota bacterium]